MSDDIKQRLAVLAARIEMCDKLTWGEDSAAMKDALARIEELEAKLEKAVVLDFRPGSELPDTPKGTARSFIVTVKRSGREKNFTFPAVYLNAYPLEWNEGDGCGECPEDGSHDDGCPLTMWVCDRFHPDYDSCYEPLLRHGDTLLEWAAIPNRTTLTQLKGQDDKPCPAPTAAP